MLIPFQDVLKPYQNLKLQHRGLVVKNDDPLDQGRVKCKVQGLIESSDIDRLPWCYPKESSSRGGRADSGSTAVPPLNSMVLIEFPAGGEGPVGGGNPYYPVWVGMARMDLSNPGIGKSVAWPEDSSLSTPYTEGTTKSSDIETNIWVKTQSQNVSWVRIDKNRGSVEFFDQDSSTAFRVDRGGHVQMQCASLDVVTSGDVRFKIGGNFNVQAAGAAFFDVTADMGVKTGGHFAVQAGGDIDQAAAGAIAFEAGGNMSARASGDFGVEADGNASYRSGGNSTLDSGGGVAIIGAGTVSEKGAVCARDAGQITDNGGASQGPLSSTPAKPGTVDAVTSNLAGASSYTNDRASALGSIVSAMMNEANQVKQRGQQVVSQIRQWAASMTGSQI